MSIDPTIESLITMKEATDEASKFLPRHPHRNTINQWCLHGVRGVQLETIVVGGRRLTSREALRRFIERLSSKRDLLDQAA